MALTTPPRLPPHAVKRRLGPFMVGDRTTAITAGTNKHKFRMPCGFILLEIRCALETADSSGAALLTLDFNESGTTVMATTKITFDATEKTTTTAATAAVITDATIADDAEMTLDVDSVGTGADAAGLSYWLIGYEV